MHRHFALVANDDDNNNNNNKNNKGSIQSSFTRLFQSRMTPTRITIPACLLPGST